MRKKPKPKAEISAEEILSDLTVGQKVLYNGKQYRFVEYRDYGFTCMLKPPRGRNFLVFANQLKALAA